MADERYQPMTTRDHLRMLRRRRWLLLGVVAACLGVAVAYVALAARTYEARAKLVVLSEGARSSVLAAAAPMLSMLGDPVSALGGSDLATQVQIAGSRPTLQAAYGLMRERPELLARLEREGMTDELFEALPEVLASLPPQPLPEAWEEPWDALPGTLLVGTVEDARMIEVRAEATDPALARDFINAVVLAYLGRSLADAQDATRRTRRYVEEQLADVELRLAEAETSLRDFGERVGTVALDETARQQIGLAVRLSEQAAQAESTARARRAMRDELEARLEAIEPRIEQATTVARNPQIAELQRALAEAEAERAGLLEEYADEAMPVRQATATVEELRQELAETSAEVIASRQEAVNPVAQQLLQQIVVAEGEEMAARESLRVLDAASGRAEAALAGLPEDQVVLLRLQREIQLLESIYLALKQKQQEYEIGERAKSPASRLVEQAVLPSEPARPRRLLSLAAGLVAGLLLGLLAVGLAEHLDDRLGEPERAAVALGVPVLAVLGGRWREGAVADERSRQVLCSVLAQTPGRGAVLISADDGALATDVARALASVAAEDGERVLVVAGEGPGLAEAIADGGALTLTGGVTELAPGQTPLGRVDAGALDRAMAAAGQVFAAGDGAAGLLAVEPLVTAERPALLCADLRRTRAAAGERLLRLAADRDLPVAGALVTGAGRSAVEYYPGPREPART